MSHNSPTNESSSALTRRRFLRSGVLAGMAASIAATPAASALARDQKHTEIGEIAPGVQPFELDEITISELQTKMKSGQYTARSITQK